MSSYVCQHVLYKITNTRIHEHPFPHIYVRDVFPEDYYREMRAQLPPPEAYQDLKAMGRVGPDYSDSRRVLPVTPDKVQALPEPSRSFWAWTARWLMGGDFDQRMLSKFAPYVEQRFGDTRNAKFNDEALIVRDSSTYVLGVHNDTPRKVLSFRFYLPADDSMAHLGTSIYTPKDPGFRCNKGMHYPFDGFHRVITMPYLPNTLFAFLRTTNSFHGVEPITGARVDRDLLLYDIQVENPPELMEQAHSARFLM